MKCVVFVYFYLWEIKYPLLFICSPSNSFCILFTGNPLTLFILCLFSLYTLFPAHIPLLSFKNLNQFTLTSMCLSKSPTFHIHPFSLSLHISACIPCAVEGQWLEWGPWSRCSVTCNTGTQERQRRCSASVHGWAECKGPHQESRECTNPSCSGKTHKWTLSAHTSMLSSVITETWNIHYPEESIRSSLCHAGSVCLQIMTGKQFGVFLVAMVAQRATVMVLCNNLESDSGFYSIKIREALKL